MLFELIFYRKCSSTHQKCHVNKDVFDFSANVLSFLRFEADWRHLNLYFEEHTKQNRFPLRSHKSFLRLRYPFKMVKKLQGIIL